MPPAVVMQDASIRAQMPFKCSPIHAVCLDRRDIVCRINFARESFSAFIASLAIKKHSAIVSPCVINSGSKGEVTIKPPSSASSIINTNFPSLIV